MNPMEHVRRRGQYRGATDGPTSYRKNFLVECTDDGISPPSSMMTILERLVLALYRGRGNFGGAGCGWGPQRGSPRSQTVHPATTWMRLIERFCSS
jgi:hypothetical protein